MEKLELDELDDLLDDNDLIEYQVILEGYDENDNSVNYYEIIEISKDEDEAVHFAQNYDETSELSSKTILKKRNAAYVRINVVPVVKFDDFEEAEDLIYSKVILLK